MLNLFGPEDTPHPPVCENDHFLVFLRHWCIFFLYTFFDRFTKEIHYIYQGNTLYKWKYTVFIKEMQHFLKRKQRVARTKKGNLHITSYRKIDRVIKKRAAGAKIFRIPSVYLQILRRKARIHALK